MHSNKKAVKCSSDDMSGLVPKLSLSNGGRVMLTRNLWTDVSLCNGAVGTVLSIVYKQIGFPPDFPIAILVRFDSDSYTGPSFLSDIPKVVPIPPCSSVSESLGNNYERTQFPLRLA